MLKLPPDQPDTIWAVTVKIFFQVCPLEISLWPGHSNTTIDLLYCNVPNQYTSTSLLPHDKPVAPLPAWISQVSNQSLTIQILYG